MAADHGEVVRELVAATDGQAGHENVCPQIRKARNVKPHLPGLVGNHVEVVIVPLHTGFILRSGAEQMVPGGLERVVVVVDGASAREASKGLHIRTFFPVMAGPVIYRELVGFVEMVIKAAGGKVCSRRKIKQNSVVLKLGHEDVTSGTSRIQGQTPAEYNRTGMGGQVRGQAQTSRHGAAAGTA